MRSIKLTLCSAQFMLQSLLVAVFCFVLYGYVKHALYEEFAESLDSYAENIAARLEVEHEYGRLKIELEGEHVRDTDSYYVITDPKGKIVIQSPSMSDVDWELPPLGEETAELGASMSLGEDEAGRYKVVKFAPVIDDRISKNANWTVFVAKPTAELKSALDALLFGSVLCAVMLVVVSAVTNYFSVRHALRPLHSIEQEVAELDTMTLDQRISEEKLPSELKQIVSKVNALLTRLDHGFAREKRFSSNAAHELRTPIAELKTIMQVGMMSKEQGYEEFQEFFRDGEQVVQRMQRLLETLLAVVRNGSSEIKLQKTNVDVRELLSRYPDVSVETDDEGVVAHVDRAIFLAILDNLISNARDHGTGEITVRLRREGGKNKGSGSWGVSICNTTEELEVGDMEHITEPFWRKEASRSDQSYAGLGLSLVQSYCSIHRWKLEFSMTEEGVFNATVSGIEIAD